jgi:hypothetical protein
MTTILLGHNRFTDCRSLLSVKGSVLLRVSKDPLRVTLRTPGDLPSGFKLEIEDNEIRAIEDADGRRPRILAGSDHVAVFWEEAAILQATILDEATVHLRVDLRPLGLKVYDDPEGLHVGANTLALNAFSGCGTAIAVE